MSLPNTANPSLSRPSDTADTNGANRPAASARTVKPVYSIKETPEEFGATVHLPGVAKEALEITAEEGQVRIVGRKAWAQPDSWTAIHRESVNADFELVLAHDNSVDPQKITAELRDGVLQLSLAKQEAVKPRKIAVS